LQATRRVGIVGKPLVEKQKNNLTKYHRKKQVWVPPQGCGWKNKERKRWLKAFLDILQQEGPTWLDGVRIRKGANFDSIDVPLNDAENMKERFRSIRKL